MWIERHTAERVLAAARQFPSLVVTGGRQTGKTTLLRHLFPEASFASLDPPSAAHQADERGEEFLAGYQEPVILDEVQYAPGLFRHLKVAIDAYWLSVLEASRQVVLLEPYFANPTRRLIKTPKLYFRDSGLLCFLLGLESPGALASSRSRGRSGRPSSSGRS